MGCIVPYLTMKFFLFDFFNDLLKPKPGTPKSLIVGSLTGVCALFLSHPLDLVRRRMQQAGIKGYEDRNITYTECWKKIIREDGLKGLYRGVRVASGRMALNLGIQFWVF